MSAVAIDTAMGSIKVALRPDWSASSVDFVRRVAQHDYCTFNCVFYRAEPGFLLQVRTRALVVTSRPERM